MHEFCIKFQGTLSSMIGEKICLKLNKCERIESIIQKIIIEKKIPLSIGGLLITYQGNAIKEDFTTCDVNEVEVYRMFQGG